MNITQEFARINDLNPIFIELRVDRHMKPDHIIITWHNAACAFQADF